MIPSHPSSVFPRLALRPRSMTPLSTHADVRRLAAAIRHVEQGHVAAQQPGFSSGVPELDAILPGGGFARGTILEWLDMSSAGPLRGHGSPGPCFPGPWGWRGHAAGRPGRHPGLPRRRSFRRHRPRSAVLSPCRRGLGDSARRTILLRPTNSRDADWALDQTLRTPGVAAVLDWPRKLDPRAQRRLQLAAETCGVVGLLVRNAAAAREPSWAKIRLAVTAVARSPVESGQLESAWRLDVQSLRGTQRATECLMTND